jgi:hypothetical protein
MHNERTRARLVAGLGSIVALFFLMLGVDALQTVPAGSIAAQWPLDSVTTTTADVSGNNNTATLVAAPTSQVALFGNGLKFVSGTKQSLSVPNSASLAFGTGSFSVGAWVKPSGTTAMRLINKWNGTTGWLLDINAAAGGGNSAASLRLYLKDDGAHIHDYAVANSGLGNNTWKHLAAVVDRTAKKAYLYVNGVQVGATHDITTLTGTLANTGPLQIGTYGAGGPFYNGLIDEPIVYSQVLTPAQIKALAAVPQNVTATTTLTDKVTLNWTAIGGATLKYNVLRSGTNGGPYTLLTTVTTNTYTDTTATSPGPYYYVVQSVFTTADGFTSTNSDQATGASLPPQVTALPNTGLQTNENGASTQFTIKFNQAAPAGGSLVTVSSSNTSEGVVSTTFDTVPPSRATTATGFQLSVPAGSSPTFVVKVTGVDGDVVADPAHPYTITVTASGFAGLVIPAVQCVNNDNDTPGITVSQTSGLVTTESGGTDTFTVSLDTQPFGDVRLDLSSSNPGEATVSPAFIIFTPANYKSLLVTVTGVDDSVIDLTVPYTIELHPLTTTDPRDEAAYKGLKPPDVSGVNMDNEIIPPADGAWGSSNGGCGLLGLEALLALLLAARGRGRIR